MSVITSWRVEHRGGRAALRKPIVFQRWQAGLVKTMPTHVTQQPKISLLELAGPARVQCQRREPMKIAVVVTSSDVFVGGLDSSNFNCSG